MCGLTGVMYVEDFFVETAFLKDCRKMTNRSVVYNFLFLFEFLWLTFVIIENCQWRRRTDLLRSRRFMATVA
jgi:hypothetical protein